MAPQSLDTDASTIVADTPTASGLILATSTGVFETPTSAPPIASGFTLTIFSSLSASSSGTKTPTSPPDPPQRSANLILIIPLAAVGTVGLLVGAGIVLWCCRRKRLRTKHSGHVISKPTMVYATVTGFSQEENLALVGRQSDGTSATLPTDDRESLTPFASTGSLRGQSFEFPNPARRHIAFTSSPLHSPALTLIDSQAASDNDEASKISAGDPATPVSPPVPQPAGPDDSPPLSPEEASAADAERRHAALLEMLEHEPPQLWRPRRRRRSIDGGVVMNGTGPTNGAPSPAPTTTTFMTDMATASISTLPPRYAEYEQRERVYRETHSSTESESEPPVY